MRRILTASVVFALAVCSGALATPARWKALGGDHRFIIDNDNFLTYSGRVASYGDSLYVIPLPNFRDNDVAGNVLFEFTPRLTLGFDYNLGFPGAQNLRSALQRSKPDKRDLDDAERAAQREEVATPAPETAKTWLAAMRQRARLAALDIKPFPDLLWGMKRGNTSLGARLAVAKGSSSDAASPVEEPIIDQDGTLIGVKTLLAEERTGSATALNLSLGATMYETSVGDLDLGLRIGTQGFSAEDPNEDLKIDSTGGLDLALDVRLNKPVGEDGNRTLVPLLGLNIGSVPSAEYDATVAPDVTEISFVNADIGVGLRERIDERSTFIAGLLLGYATTTEQRTTTIEKEPAQEGGKTTRERQELPEITDTSLHATVLAGYEFAVSKRLTVRGGANVRFSAVSDEMTVQEKTEFRIAGKEDVIKDVVGEQKSTSVDYFYNLGLRTTFGGLVVDVLLARNIAHRGPYFLTGATGNWATEVSVLYEF